ncbi:hypothetical protein BKA65DRAFT_472759 [Rhexocercosporidium sp. MPI-PUGE-AT-0058]|nr:hypothetical protein BKA65DRAFT_472759 [Rhexocercosporidium sp. MPI-PUGE-AT-0058]
MQTASPEGNATSRNSDSNSPPSTKYTNMSPPPRPRRPSDFNIGPFNPNFHTLQSWPQQPQPQYAPLPFHLPQSQPPRQSFHFQPQPQPQPLPPPPIQAKHDKPSEENLISEAEQERLHQLAKKLAKERTEKWVESLFELYPNV